MKLSILEETLKSLVKGKTCFKNPENPRCIDLFITNSIACFQKTTAVASGLSNFHKMIMAVWKASFQKSKPKEILYTVKRVYNDHLGDRVSVVVIDRWSL